MSWCFVPLTGKKYGVAIVGKYSGGTSRFINSAKQEWTAHITCIINFRCRQKNFVGSVASRWWSYNCNCLLRRRKLRQGFKRQNSNTEFLSSMDELFFSARISCYRLFRRWWLDWTIQQHTSSFVGESDGHPQSQPHRGMYFTWNFEHGVCQHWRLRIKSHSVVRLAAIKAILNSVNCRPNGVCYILGYRFI